jgi:hypothetical protein
MDVYAGLLAQDGEKQDVDRYEHLWINLTIQASRVGCMDSDSNIQTF